MNFNRLQPRSRRHCGTSFRALAQAEEIGFRHDIKHKTWISCTNWKPSHHIASLCFGPDMPMSIWVKLLDAYSLVSFQQWSMETDVFLLFSILGKQEQLCWDCVQKKFSVLPLHSRTWKCWHREQGFIRIISRQGHWAQFWATVHVGIVDLVSQGVKILYQNACYSWAWPLWPWFA